MTYDNTDLQAENETLRERISELEAATSPDDEAKIAELEAAGQWGEAGVLKLNRYLQDQVSPEQPEASDTGEETPVETERDYLKEGMVKFAAFQAAANPVPAGDPEAQAQIAELEAAGKWAEAGRAKLAAAGLSNLEIGNQ